MKKLLLYICVLLLPTMIRAVEPAAAPTEQPITEQPTAEADSTDAAEEAVLEELAEITDSINAAAEAQRALVEIEQTELDKRLIDWALAWLDTTACTSTPDTTRIPDSLFIARLQALPNEIAMPYNDVVRKFIEMYVLRRPRQLASLKRLSEYYFPLFEDKLCEYDLPQELKYLAVIESALNASARSHAGAAGLWQFMPSTGRNYGLEVNSLIDERLDPYKATDAACRCLRSLYNLFGDWHLALAAYNCGPGNINKAIRRSGGKTDFWEIYPWLPKETRSYVPIFIAANYALNYSDEHGICPDTIWEGTKLKQRGILMPMLVDTIQTGHRQHLKQTSEVLGLPIDELRRLNPAYIKDVLPGGKPYTLVLPVDYVGAYIQYEDTILAHQADSLIIKQQAAIELARKSASENSYTQGGVTYYIVKKGDTLGAIAKKYHCTVAQLQRWNNLKNTNLQIKQKLKILK